MEEFDPLVVTVGDPCGVGPEVIHAALKQTNVLRWRDVYVFGDLEPYSRALGSHNELHMYNIVPFDDFIADYGPILNEFERVNAGRKRPFFIDLGGEIGGSLIGVGSAHSGELALGALDAALDFIDLGVSDILVTGPISKRWVHAAGYEFPGHTEGLAEHFEADPIMMMVGGGLRVGLATVHMPLGLVPTILTSEHIERCVKQLADSMKQDFFIKKPKIAVAGLNPHPGEFGDEEERIIEPAIAKAREAGIDVVGPLAADTIFGRQLHGEFHAVLALYHDQGLIPVKLLAMDSGVNFSAGLPIVRTSPDHGTAYDIAGKGKANPGAMLAAIEFADAVARRRDGEYVPETLCEQPLESLTRSTQRLRATGEVHHRKSSRMQSKTTVVENPSEAETLDGFQKTRRMR